MTEVETLDPRKTLFISLYKDPKSETFGNKYQTALKVGFSPSYAKAITSLKPDWLSDIVIKDVKRIKQAEKNLDKYNNYKLDPKDIITRRDVEVAKIKIDVSKFLLKTQAKEKYNETETPNAPNVQVNIVNYNKDKDDKGKTASVEVHTIPSTPQDGSSQEV